MAVLLGASSGASIETLVELMERFPGRGEVFDLSQVSLVVLSQVDPEKGLALVRAMSRGSGDHEALEGMLSSWVRTDLAGAREAMESMSGKERRVAVQVLGQFLDETDPQSAWAWWKRLPAEDRLDAVDGMNMEWLYEYGKEELFPLVEALPAGKRRRAAEMELFGVLAEKDPDRAVRWFRSRNGRITREQISALLTIRNPKALNELLMMDFPSATFTQADALRRIARSWSGEAPETVDAWMATTHGNAACSCAWRAIGCGRE